MTDRPHRAARCSCGAAVFHDQDFIVDGFLTDHAPGRRPTCIWLEEAPTLDELQGQTRLPL